MLLFNQLLGVLTFSFWQFLLFLNWTIALQSTVFLQRREKILGTIKLAEEYCMALVGTHAFSGNDYISSFSSEPKKKCWNIHEKFPKLFTCFKTLVRTQERHEDLFGQLEEFVCFVHSAKVININDIRQKKFN